MLIGVMHQRGMGLLELMVGVTLAALLLAMSLPSIEAGVQNRQIRTAADAIQNGLQVARTEALKRNRNVKFQLQAGGNSWTVGCESVDLTTDPTTGEVLCPATIQSRDQNEGSTKAAVTTSQLLTGGSAPSTTTFTDTVSFTPLGRTTPATLPAGNMGLFDVGIPPGACVASGGDLRCLRVVVTSTGQIRMCDPAVTASTDPRKC